MATPNDSLTPYCTPTRMLQAYDVRTLGDLLQDGDQRMTPLDVQNSPILYVLLQEASGWFESAIIVGSKYSVQAVQQVMAENGNGASFISGLIAGIAMWMCFDRRPEKASKYELPAKAQLAMEMLDRLRLGERILPLQENANAGLPSSMVLTPAIVWNQNLATTQAFRYFGQRDNQRFPPPGY
jgi:hypothetical protein